MVVRNTQVILKVLTHLSVWCVILLATRIGWQHELAADYTLFFAPVRGLSVSLFHAVQYGTEVVLVPWNEATELRELKIRYVTLLAEQQELEQLRQENAELRKQIAIPERQRIGKRFASVYSYVFPSISSGSSDGVSSGMSVLQDGILLGTVSEVKERVSTVKLLTRRTLDEPLLVETEAGVLGLLVTRTGSLYIEQLPLTATVTEGERILTLGQDGVAPHKVIGIVQGLERDDQTGTQRAAVVQPVTFYTATVVTLE